MNALKFLGGYILAGTAVQLTVTAVGYMAGKSSASKEATKQETK
jgi:hypothetical protein